MKHASISIRPAAPEDRDAVLALGPRLAEGTAPWRNQDEARQAGGRWLKGSLDSAAAGEGVVFVAVDPSAQGTPEVLGVVSVSPHRHFTGERDGYIGELVVAGHASRRGIGRALIEAAGAWARDQGLAHLTLHTGIYNANARAFYAALGFAEEEVRLTLPL